MHTCLFLKKEVLYSYRKKIILKWYFLVLNTNLYFLHHLSNWQGVGPVWAISVSFVYTGLLVWAFLQWHKLNLYYCLNSSLLLAFCSLFVCIVDQTQMYLSSISPLGLFQKIIVWTPSHFWKIIKGGSNFLVKMGVAHTEGLFIEMGGKYCFSLVIYRICSSNALYSASHSFRMFIIILD